MKKRALIAFAFVGLALVVLSCIAGKGKVDDTGGRGETAEVMAEDEAGGRGAPEVVESRELMDDGRIDSSDICQPSCHGKECGADGCGSTCGECPSGSVCASGGSCADCMETFGLEGGLGTPCEDDEDCLIYNFCLAPDGSDDKVCTCSCQDDCPSAFECVAVYQWRPEVFFGCFPPCEPDCDGKECGDDGCGRICGECPEQGICCGGTCPNCTCEEICNEWGCCEPSESSCTEEAEWICECQVPEQELCDGVDNDCDGTIDEGFADYDADGKANCVDSDDDDDGDPDVTDCEPLNDYVYNGAMELCDCIDNDCNGKVDEGFPDYDGNGQSDCCDPGDTDMDGDSDLTDCAPFDPSIYSGALEECNGKDENCNNQVDEGFLDTDQDGVANCVDEDDDDDGEPDATDCKPLDDSTYPEALEVCDCQDNNCNGKVDEGFPDMDGDGCCDMDDDFDGDFDPDETDCAPLDPTIFHGATEECDGVDNNCNSQVDEWFIDTDEDGEMDCVDPDDDNDLSPDQEDCDDYDPEIHPGADELCDGKDNNCNGQIDEGCPCTPDCTDKECGSDGCDGTCGDCPEGQTCNEWGQCE